MRFKTVKTLKTISSANRAFTAQWDASLIFFYYLPYKYSYLLTGQFLVDGNYLQATWWENFY